MESEPIFADKPSIVPLTKMYDVTSFTSTNAELNDFLINDALDDQDEMISRTYLCCLNESITGFFAIVADTIEVQAIDEAGGVDGYPYHKYPSIKIARLGFRVVERYKQADFPKMYIDMQPVVERMKPEESLEDFVG